MIEQADVLRSGLLHSVGDRAGVLGAIRKVQVETQAVTQ